MSSSERSFGIIFSTSICKPNRTSRAKAQKFICRTAPTSENLLEIMVGVTYDFAILGDGQPEGLLVASGLVRKGFSVVVIPSAMLGEGPPDEAWPLMLPAQLGSRRLNDLLFRAGFFRLEESGLVPSAFESQIVLPKNRLLFDGSRERFVAEVEREFPVVSKDLVKIWDNLRKPTAQTVQKSSADLFDLQKKDPALRSWISAEVTSSLRPLEDLDRPVTGLKRWLENLLRQGNKTYRVDPKLRQPYHQFLLDHSRKWGANVWNDALDFKASWSHFQISPAARVRHLILNGTGGGRVVSKLLSNAHRFDRMEYWMYIDRLECPIEHISEPLQEFCHIDYQEGISGAPSVRFVRTLRDFARGEAHLMVGSWLPFEDNKAWVSQVEYGRKSLKRLMPFLPDDVFKPIPSLLDLTETRGDCIKRGHSELLIPSIEKLSAWKNWKIKMASLWPRKKGRPYTVSKRIFPVTPHHLPFRSRRTSFEQCLSLLDFFEKKRQISN